MKFEPMQKKKYTSNYELRLLGIIPSNRQPGGINIGTSIMILEEVWFIHLSPLPFSSEACF